MTEPTQDKTLAQATILLSRYGFEMKGYIPQEAIDKWLKDDYSAKWIRTAIIEALYQGRYKAISVEQILKLWRRREQITCHFTHEFERLICRNLPYSNEILYSPKSSELDTQRKSFNPPLINQQNTVQPNSVNSTIERTKPELLKEPNEVTELELADENSISSKESTNHSSDNYAVDLPIANNPEINQLSPSKKPIVLTVDSKDNHSHNFQATLTNLEELFSQVFTKGNSKNSGSSAFYTNLANTYQWRGIMSGRTIDEFIPQLDSSELYSKLKAVIQQETRVNTQH